MRRSIPTPKLLRFSRQFTTTRTTLSAFNRGPAPPRLPKEEQEIFERLQRQSTGAFSTPTDLRTAPSSPRPRPQINQSPHSAPEGAAATSSAAPTTAAPNAPSSGLRARINQSPDSTTSTSADSSTGKNYEIEAEGEGEELHPHIRRGAQPEFQGDVNPKTGEVGGPKNDPLRWGGAGDWSYNGRVTDF